MAVSFAVYPVYPILLALPVSGEMRVAATVASSLVSWGVFSVGIFLAGREGYDWLKAQWRR
jgi:hypothetical protein